MPFLWAKKKRGGVRPGVLRAGPKRCRRRRGDIMTPPASPLLSGYRMRLGSSTDKKDSGRLHVDFAQARDDFYEWECKQRMRAREERHRRKLEEDRLRPPSPPAIMHYSEHEAALLADKLKGRGPPSRLRPGGRHGPLAGQHRHPPAPPTARSPRAGCVQATAPGSRGPLRFLPLLGRSPAPAHLCSCTSV